MEKVLRLLQPFYEITKKISGEQSILSSVIPDVTALERYLLKCSRKDAGVHTLKEELRKSLQKRFFSNDDGQVNILSDKEFLMSTVLDPRFKGRYMPQNAFSSARTMLLEELKNIATVDTSKDQNENEEAESPSAKKSKSQSQSLQEEIHQDFSSCYDEVCQRNELEAGVQAENSESDEEMIIGELQTRRRRQSCLEVPLSVIVAEMEGYLNMPVIERNESPFLWWKQQQTAFPRVAKLAGRFLSAPASSVVSERLFSEAGNIFDEKRSRLLPRNGEKLLFLHHNLDKF